MSLIDTRIHPAADLAPTKPPAPSGVIDSTTKQAVGPAESRAASTVDPTGTSATEPTSDTPAAPAPSRRRLDVVRPGMQTTVQDWPGRIGYWHIGVPPSGPMDDLSFRLGNRVLGNLEG
ncbi:hypothetical protein ACFWF3_35160, partial [Nocardia sp. NPDC060220]